MKSNPWYQRDQPKVKRGRGGRRGRAARRVNQQPQCRGWWAFGCEITPSLARCAEGAGLTLTQLFEARKAWLKEWAAMDAELDAVAPDPLSGNSEASSDSGKD